MALDGVLASGSTERTFLLRGCMSTIDRTGNESPHHGARPDAWSLLIFEVCLIRLRWRHTRLPSRNTCMETMHALCVSYPSLIQVALREMGRSPRLCYYCLTFFLGLPDSMLKRDPFLGLRFGLLGGGGDLRSRIEECHLSILLCFPNAGR